VRSILRKARKINKMKIQTLDHIAIISKDIGRSVKWYTEVLGLEHVFKGQWDGVPTFVVTKENNTGIAIFPSDTDSPKSRPDGDYLIVDHFAFRISGEDFEKAQSELKEKGIEIRVADHIVAKSIYMHDPDGHKVELTTYEI
jgi:catechol 2,3-dioxygenase-like lactoylglutathione lyase family enzyme